MQHQKNLILHNSYNIILIGTSYKHAYTRTHMYTHNIMYACTRVHRRIHNRFIHCYHWICCHLLTALVVAILFQGISKISLDLQSQCLQCSGSQECSQVGLQDSRLAVQLGHDQKLSGRWKTGCIQRETV